MFYLLICVTGLGSLTHGYHYLMPPTLFHTPNAPSFGHFGSNSQTGFKHSTWQTQWKYDWNKPNGNAYGSSEMGHNHANEMIQTSHLASNRNENSQTVPERTNTSEPITENDPMDQNYLTTTPRPRPQTTQAPFGPEPGTMSKPVPKLGELFAPSLQWHVGIYSKKFTPYMQVCGGSLVRPDVVLSEMLRTSDLASNPNDNSQTVPERFPSLPTTENDPMDHIKKNVTTTTPDPAELHRPFAEPGTMSKPVPKLGELFAPSLQWHVGIYSKRFTPYMQVCGGSLVRPDVVLSAAHCFWDDEVGALREGLFGVAAAKLLRPWETEGEIYTQHSDIKEIKIPPRFQGAKTSFQDDIAIVFLSSPLEYAPGVKPICLRFDRETERRLLKSGNLGTIAGWGLTMPNGPPSQRLNYLELPYVDIQECIRTAEPSFLKYITSDKICAGDNKTGRALCKGDSGGGLTYYSDEVPYLVGIASVALRDEHECNAYAVGTFTYTRAHSAFLREHVPMIDEGCEELYSNATAVQNETIAGVTQSPTVEEVKVYIPQLGEDVPMPAFITDEKTPNIVTDNGGIMETVTKIQKMNETMGATQDEQLLIKQGISLPDTIDRTPTILVKKPVTDQKMVMMTVESGEQSAVTVPVEGASTLVCNCYCKN